MLRHTLEANVSFHSGGYESGFTDIKRSEFKKFKSSFSLFCLQLKQRWITALQRRFVTKNIIKVCVSPISFTGRMFLLHYTEEQLSAALFICSFYQFLYFCISESCCMAGPSAFGIRCLKIPKVIYSYVHLRRTSSGCHEKRSK